MFATGAGDEDAAHGLGGRPEKMRAVLPRLRARIHQFEPHLVHECRRLKSMAGRFGGHLVRGQASQFIVNNGQQFVRGSGIALLNSGKDVGDVAHPFPPSFSRLFPLGSSFISSSASAWKRRSSSFGCSLSGMARLYHWPASSLSPSFQCAMARKKKSKLWLAILSET